MPWPFRSRDLRASAGDVRRGMARRRMAGAASRRGPPSGWPSWRPSWAFSSAGAAQVLTERELHLARGGCSSKLPATLRPGGVPPACAIQELKGGRYPGEPRFPWVLNNYHRYFLLLSVVVIVFLWVDVVRAFPSHAHFFIGLGSLILLLNVALLSLYPFTCHSFRYVMGGRIDAFSRVLAGKLWHRVVMLLNWANPRHGLYAWVSMFSVALTDVYVRLLMAGVLHEPRWIA